MTGGGAMPPEGGAEKYTADDFGPSHRWAVFVCEKTGHPMEVAYEPGEFAEEPCPCGALLVPVLVQPVTEEADRVS